MRKLVVTASAVLIAASAALGAAQADPIAEFYKDKTITLFIGAGVGGSYDLYSRLLAEHMSKHIPGKPNIITKNVLGGGGGLPAAIHMQRSVPRDGTAIAMTQQTIVVAQVIEKVAAGKYDVRQWGWIGLMAPIRNMLAVWHTAPAQTLDEARHKEVVVGSTGRTSPTYIVPQVLNEIHGTKFKIVSGYNGVAQLNLAMERGEIQGRGASWISVVAGKPAYIAEKKLKALVVDGLTRDPLIPDAPRLIELAKTDRARQAVTLISASSEFGRAVFAPPGIPADRLAALRKAFDAAIKDPALLADAKKRKLVIEPQNGAKLQKTTADVVSASPEAIAYARQLMGSK
ncbi:MAG: Bug family tripartite tricarboxylate transporter substrate binding protein [Xanthobacteraceae bacterium]